MKKITLILLILLFLSSLTTYAATIKGSIYDSNLELDKDTLIEINTEPAQKYLSKDGSYSFEIPIGKYSLTARKGFIQTKEDINIVKEGTFTLDLFLLPDFTEEDELWEETEEDLFADDSNEKKGSTGIDYKKILGYLIAIPLALWAIMRYARLRKKYGPLRKFKREVKVEHSKSIEEHKKDLAREPGYLEETLEIIKKHDGRISQKELRKEMLHLSEAKVSLIITELEHKRIVEKVKKGRGNVILLKD